MAQPLTAWLQGLMARQLSLFEDAPAAKHPAAKPPADKAPSVDSTPVKDQQPKQPDWAAPPALQTPQKPPALEPPAVNLPDALGSANFKHPQANRSVKLAGHAVEYWLKRGKRRTIGMLVGPEGLSVSAPRWAGLREIDAALVEKADWILRKLAEAKAKFKQHQEQKLVWANGEHVPYLGQPIKLVLDAGHRWDQTAKGQPQLVVSSDSLQMPELHLGLPHNATPQQIKDAGTAWLMRQALRVFKERLDHFAPQLGVRYTSLRLSSASTRWGSATTGGAIRLNWRLIHLPQSSLDYVVVHELSHLREMNHSPQFWGVVGSVMPDYIERRKLLKATSAVSD